MFVMVVEVKLKCCCIRIFNLVVRCRLVRILWILLVKIGDNCKKVLRKIIYKVLFYGSFVLSIFL